MGRMDAGQPPITTASSDIGAVAGMVILPPPKLIDKSSGTLYNSIVDAPLIEALPTTQPINLKVQGHQSIEGHINQGSYLASKVWPRGKNLAGINRSFWLR
jgi:hypothetical protein